VIEPERASAGETRLAFALLIVVYFVYFSWPGTFAPLALDTFANIDGYWRQGVSRLAVSQFQLWGGSYRPMGALFYLPIFHFFGLTPAPYHVAMALVALANVFLTYAFARALGCGDLVSGLAALAVSYHSGLKDIYYNTSFIYDVLCFFFYFASFTYYCRIRSRQRLLRPLETAAFLALYICALNSKEMAVTLPAALATYEWIYHGRPELNWRGLLHWLRGPGRAAMMAGLLAALSVYGKMHGPSALGNVSAYHPVFSWQRFLDFQYGQMSDILPGWRYSWAGLSITWLIVIYLAWQRPRPALRFCFVFAAIAPLPIEFLEARRGACLYIPLAAWAVFASVIFVDVTRVVAGFLARAPWLRGLSTKTLEVTVCALGVCGWAAANRMRQAEFLPAMATVGGPATDIIRQLNELHPRVRPNSQVIFLHDPLPARDIQPVAGLWFHDRSVIVRSAKTSPPVAPEDVALIQSCFDFRDGKLLPGCQPPSARPLTPVPAGTYDDSDPAIQFRGIWERFADFDGAAAGTLTASDKPGAEISLAFEGAALTYVFTKAFNRGLAEVEIDGVEKRIIDLYAPRIEWQSRVTFCCLGHGTHVAKIGVLGRNSSRSSGNFVDLDAFVVE
jgi:hypothetical protein